MNTDNTDWMEECRIKVEKELTALGRKSERIGQDEYVHCKPLHSSKKGFQRFEKVYVIQHEDINDAEILSFRWDKRYKEFLELLLQKAEEDTDWRQHTYIAFINNVFRKAGKPWRIAGLRGIFKKPAIGTIIKNDSEPQTIVYYPTK